MNTHVFVRVTSMYIIFYVYVTGYERVTSVVVPDVVSIAVQ